jgi:hypothetical protein
VNLFTYMAMGGSEFALKDERQTPSMKGSSINGTQNNSR